MARSKIREDQVLDEDFLSEVEHSDWAHHFIQEVDTPATYSGALGKYLSVSASGIEFVDDLYTKYEVDTISGSLQADIDATPDTLLDLLDTPTTYSGSAQKHVRVKNDVSGIEFVDYASNPKYYIAENVNIEVGEHEQYVIHVRDYLEVDGSITLAAGAELIFDVLTLLELIDTPSTYDNGKYLRSTSTTTEWYDIADDHYTKYEVDTISGSLQTEIDGKDNYLSWSFAVDGVTKDPITSGDVLNFIGGPNINITRSADDEITVSGCDGDFSNGGEAGGANRSLGNTDNYSLSLETNNLNRLTVQADGDILLTNDLILENTTFINQDGIIYKNTTPFIHDFNYGDNGIVTTEGHNIFVGEDAGNFTMGSTATGASQASYNIGIGHQSLYSNTTGNYNVANGHRSLYSNTRGYCNVANGYQSLYSNITGNSNVANGYVTLYSNTTGNYNVANGHRSLYSNTTGNGNVANGYATLHSNTTGSLNVANGYTSLYRNTTGSYNLGAGSESLYNNTEGESNVANGYQSLYSNTTGDDNVATGYQTLYNNTTGESNVANGYQSLYSNTEGYHNVATGYFSLYNNTTGAYNTATGGYTLLNNTTGNYNVATGHSSLYYNTTGSNNITIGGLSLHNNTTGNSNVSAGYAALYFNSTGSYNTANGYIALYRNTIGIHNVANGAESLYNNTIGSYNIANGYQALYSNTEGEFNVAIGIKVLYSNTIGGQNTANGHQALYENTEGSNNLANGVNALRYNTTGSTNVANGIYVLFSNTTGNNNTATGPYALYSNTTGSNNIATGYMSLLCNTTGNYNIANGEQAGRYTSTGGNNTTGFNNIFLGYDTRPLADGDNNEIVIGFEVTGSGSNTVTLGNASITDTYLKGVVEADSAIIGTVPINSGEVDGRDVSVDGTKLDGIEDNATADQTKLEIINLGIIGDEFETVSKNLKSYAGTFNYTGDDLTSIVYTVGANIITKTFNYTGDNLTSIVLSGTTPVGIDLIKTLSYTGDNLTGVTYT